MSKATLTMIGMYNWDSDLFRNLILPDGIDRDTEINTILLRSGEFEVIYSDFDFMQEMIGLISKKWARTFQKWYDALQLDYNPIENYDRYETWTDTGSNTGTVKHGITKNSTSTESETSKGSTSEDVKGSNSENVTGSNTESVKGSSSDKSSSTSTTDTLVSTYDSDSLHEDNQNKSNQSATSSGTTSQDTSGSNKQFTTGSSIQNSTGSDQRSTNSSGSVSETSSDDETRNLGTSGQHEGHIHGNIGVTTSQQMLEAELDLQEWNLYEHIADIFVRELCIPVY